MSHASQFDSGSSEYIDGGDPFQTALTTTTVPPWEMSGNKALQWELFSVPRRKDGRLLFFFRSSSSGNYLSGGDPEDIDSQALITKVKNPNDLQNNEYVQWDLSHGGRGYVLRSISSGKYLGVGNINEKKSAILTNSVPEPSDENVRWIIATFCPVMNSCGKVSVLLLADYNE